MTKIERSDKTCNDCSTQLFYHNPRQMFGCEDCGKVWSMESLEGWWESDDMPPARGQFSDYF